MPARSALLCLLTTQPWVQAELAPAAPERLELSLDQAIARFRKEGLDLLLAEAAVDQARGDLQSNGALPAPAISATAGRTKGGYDPVAAGPGASDRAYAYGISDSNALSDLLWGKRALRVKLYSAALQAAKKGRQDAERTLLATLKQQYLQAALGWVGLDLAQQAQASTRRTFDLVQARRNAGALSDAEVVRARVADLEASQAVDSAQQAAKSAQAGLAFLLGYRGGFPEFRLTTSFEHPDPAAFAPAEPRPALAQALSLRPDLQAAEAQVRRADAGLSLARRNWAPDLTWSFGISQEGSGQFALQPRTYTLGLSLPLPSIARTRGGILKAQADLRTQQLQRAKTEAQVALDVANASAALSATRSRLQRMGADLLPSARRALELVSFQYEKGAASLLDVLDAQRTLIAVQAEYVQNLTDFWNARFQMDQALGKE